MKKKIKKTGEIIDVIGYSSGTKPSKLDIVNYIGENGIEVSANLNYYLDLEDVIMEFPDYWQKLRHEAAVSALAGITASNTILGTDEKVDLAIKMADKLICKLKNENKQEPQYISGGCSQIHEYVDLGLPSGTLWATENIKDANGNEMYFAWGEAQGYTSGQVGTDKYFACEGDHADYKFGHVDWSDETNYGLTKYNKIDRKTVLEASDDAATVNWGSDWKMPTKEQFEELIANTEYEWTKVNGIKGGKLTSKVDGYTDKFLFFPAVGDAADGKVYYVGVYGGYRSVSLDDGGVYGAWELYFEDGGCGVLNNYRYFGHSVRPVLRGRFKNNT